VLQQEIDLPLQRFLGLEFPRAPLCCSLWRHGWFWLGWRAHERFMDLSSLIRPNNGLIDMCIEYIRYKD
jgi:hypothetical protein